MFHGENGFWASRRFFGAARGLGGRESGAGVVKLPTPVGFLIVHCPLSIVLRYVNNVTRDETLLFPEIFEKCSTGNICFWPDVVFLK
jgi:hypothetical protein